MKFKLLSTHFTEEDKLLEAGTEVGVGTPHRWTRPPTLEMEALDKEAEVALEKERIRMEGRTMDPLNQLPLTLDPAEQLRLILQNLNPDEVRKLLMDEVANLPPVVKGTKV